MNNQIQGVQYTFDSSDASIFMDSLHYLGISYGRHWGMSDNKKVIIVFQILLRDKVVTNQIYAAINNTY